MAKKILYVVPPTAHFAGIEHVVHGIAGGLATMFSDQFDVTVLYCGRYAEVSGVLPYHVIFEDVARLRTFPAKVGKHIGHKRYDAVIIAQFEATALVWLYHRLRGGRARFVMHLHGNPKVESTGSLRARLAFLSFRHIASRMHRVVAVSASLGQYLEGRVRDPELVEYLPNPVRQFSDVASTTVAGAPVSFVSIGRLARQKGHDVLIHAFAKLIATGVDARLEIVGGGDEHVPLEALIAELKLNDRVRLRGTIANPEAQLAAADCFVSASRWEGFGVAIVEALSAGLYVIATDCEFGPSDVINAPELGRIVPSENPDRLADAMYDFAISKFDSAHRTLRQAAAALFDIDAVVARHAEMLQLVVEDRR